MDQNTKPCTLCGIVKHFDQFNKHPNAKFGIAPRCKECLAPQKSAYYQNNKDKWQEREAEMRTKDPEGLKKKNRDASARWRSNPENTRQKRMKYIEKRYGITYEQYEAMEKAQNGLCKICLKLPTNSWSDRLHVDHDHKTGEVRGLLCYMCNVAVGNLEDSPERADRVAAYLRKTLYF